MAKKKIANPLFLEFINHPQKGECAGCDPWESVEYCLRNLFEKSDLLSCPVHPDVLKKAIKDFDLNNKKFIGSMIDLSSDIYRFINMSIMDQEKYPGKETLDDLEIFDIFPELLPSGITPFLCRRNGDGFEVKLAYVEPTDGSLPVPELIRIISVDFISFLLKHYKPGIFAVCKLDGCDSITLTSSNRKHCCKEHTDETWRRKREKNKDRDEYKRIRNKFYKQYKSNQAHQKKWSFEEFLQKEWPEDKYDLYNEFAQAAKQPTHPPDVKRANRP